MRLITLLVLLLSATAQAAVYKCVSQGKTEYSDRPCDNAAAPATLPPINTMQRKDGDDLAKQYDERLSRDKAARNQSDAEFLKSHAKKSAREKQVRAAINERRAIKGMTPAEVESALGSPDEKLPDGSWRYRRDGQRIAVRFEAGEVSGVSAKTDKDQEKYKP